MLPAGKGSEQSQKGYLYRRCDSGWCLKCAICSANYYSIAVQHTYLGKDGLFVTEPEYPEFVWKELIVNAVCHRDYYIKGTDIQVKIFDDHYTVESPGSLPGDVTKNNIRHTHFSRNPVIAEYLHAYEFVKEFGGTSPGYSASCARKRCWC